MDKGGPVQKIKWTKAEPDAGAAGHGCASWRKKQLAQAINAKDKAGRAAA